MYRKNLMQQIGLLLTGLLLINILAACSFTAGNTPAATGSNMVKLVYWKFGSATLDEDKDVPQGKWYITGAINRFESANPNIKIDMMIMPLEGMAEKFKAAGVAQNGPDISNLNTGGMLVDNKQFITPLDMYFNQEELNMIGNSILPAREGYKKDGALLGIPYTGIDTIVLFLNKALFKKAGMDENIPLKTMDDLYAACEKLKNVGIVPLADGDKNGGNMTVFFLMTLYASATANDGILAITQGKSTFSGDRDWMNSVRAWQEMYKKGYTNRDAASLEDTAAQARFLSQDTAMVCCGQWLCSSAAKALGDNLGIVTVPSLRTNVKNPGAITGGPGNAFVVTSYSKHPDEAVKFIKHLITREEVEKDITEEFHGGNITWNTEVSDDVITDPTTKMIMKLINERNVIPWMDNRLPAEVSSEMYRMNPMMLSGKLTAEEYSARLDDLMQSALNK